MKTVNSLTMILALATGTVAAGCAIEAPDDGADDGGGGGTGGGGGDHPETPTDASGNYTLRSSFDLATNAPGKVGQVVNTIIEATDDPDDPTSWILDRVIAAMPDGTLKRLLAGAKPFVAGYLNDRLLQLAPDFVPVMVQLGDRFGQIAKNFGLDETLAVSGSGAAYQSTHTVVGTHFKIDNLETDHRFADFGMADTVVEGVAVTLEPSGKLGIADHRIEVSYGKVLRIGLDAAIVPSLDPTAHDLGELMAHKVDCVGIGRAIAAAIGLGAATTFTTACTTGLAAGANLIYGKIAEIDGTALELGLTGTAKALDKNADGTIDTIQTGAWAGTIGYAGTPAPLAGATFFGSRM